ncbi:MAG: hypothetical protein R6X06_07070, partial [Gammaproteobacteria bacterium]
MLKSYRARLVFYSIMLMVFLSAMMASSYLYQPTAVMFSDAGPDVRWVGNEKGIAGDPCWSTINAD